MKELKILGKFVFELALTLVAASIVAVILAAGASAFL